MASMTVPSGREMDAQVAHRIGWSWDECTAYQPDGGRCSMLGSDPWWWLPYYSTDEGAAWAIVRALKTPDVFFELYSGVPEPASRYESDQVWTARFVRAGQLLGYGMAKEPAEAICLAALAWKV